MVDFRFEVVDLVAPLDIPWVVANGCRGRLDGTARVGHLAELVAGLGRLVVGVGAG